MTQVLFYSFQRLHGFRLVVTHVQSQQKDELQLSCTAVNLSIATKVLVVDLCAVQYAVLARKPKTQTKQQKQPSKQKTQQKQPKQTKNQKQPENTEKWDRYQKWE